MIKDNYKIRIINNKLILINIYASSEIMVFEGVAKDIISKIMNNEKIEKIIEDISVDYNQINTEVEKDVYSFINELKQLGIYNG